MKIQLQNATSIILLAIINLCICVQDFAEKTINSLNNDITIINSDSNTSNKFSSSSNTFNINSNKINLNSKSDRKSEYYKRISHNDLQPKDIVHPFEPHILRHHGADYASTASIDNTNTMNNKYPISQSNFLLIDYLADGDMERRITFNGITAKETSINSNGKSLSLWQLSNGHSFIQVIYSRDDELLDCEYLDEHSFAHDFLIKFQREVQRAAQLQNLTEIATALPHRQPDNAIPHSIKLRHYLRNDNGPAIANTATEDVGANGNDGDGMFGMRNLTFYRLSNENDIPKDLVPMMSYKRLKEQCDGRHQQMIRIVGDLSSESENDRKNATEHLNRKKRALSDWLIAPNTKWCGRGQTADKYSQLGGSSKADKCCRRHDYCKFNIHAMTTKWRLFNYRPFTISHCSCDMRQRRDLSNLLRVPGTKWCGKGYSAKKYTELGGRSKADRCCRQHDKSCPFWIMGFETKYGLFNWRINTLMHCKCDDRFRTCLKMADSSDATMVGKLFFNIVQTKCFVLKPETYCKKHHWYGTCEKKGTRKRAHLRDNKKF